MEVVLLNPKFAHNVGGTLRACSIWGVEKLTWTGDRVLDPDLWPKEARLPREERMKLYREVKLQTVPRMTDLQSRGTPVAVELRDQAENLFEFEHPEDAVYVFGPEDGSIDKGTLHACHRFVRIPSRACLNLAAAINVVLYDRAQKLHVKAQAAETTS
ncbi:MAG TPA: TrmH family RNA methyltransferase [Nitrososphaera sp.]|nr:TrmH family RNA methyltransferase [Nitrososphaera sp.]